MIRRPGGTEFDPAREGSNLPLGQRRVRRHLQLAVAADRVDQKAVVGLAVDDHRAIVAALADRFFLVEAQPRVLLLRPVALVAMFGEDGAHTLLDEFNVGRIHRPRRGGDG